MYRILHTGMTPNYGGVEAVVMNWYRNIDREKIQFDFLARHDGAPIAYEQEIIDMGGHIYREYYGRKEKPFIAGKYIQKILEICNQNEIKLVLLKIPEPTYWSVEKSASVYKYAEEIHVQYIDLNYDENINIDWDKDTQDEGNHLNIYGAEKVGKYIASYLKNNYNLDDHRNDEKYQKWNDELENYKKQKEILKERGHG